MVSGRGAGHVVGRSNQHQSQSIVLEIVGAESIALGDSATSPLVVDAAALPPADRRALHRILRHGRGHLESNPGFKKVTPREREIVGLVCEGLGNQAIAERLQISEATVRHHLTSIYAKTGVRDRVSLVIAYLHGRPAS